MSRQSNEGVVVIAAAFSGGAKDLRASFLEGKRTTAGGLGSASYFMQK
jgi:hypothetical protein